MNNNINVDAVIVEVSKLSLKEGDTLLVKTDGITPEMAKNIRENLFRVLPKGTYLCFLTKKVELTIIEKDDANQG